MTKTTSQKVHIPDEKFQIYLSLVIGLLAKWPWYMCHTRCQMMSQKLILHVNQWIGIIELTHARLCYGYLCSHMWCIGGISICRLFLIFWISKCSKKRRIISRDIASVSELFFELCDNALQRCVHVTSYYIPAWWDDIGLVFITLKMDYLRLQIDT